MELVLSDRADLFPVGTVVRAYAKSAPETGNPMGSVIAEATVAGNGSLTLTGLSAGVRYVLVSSTARLYVNTAPLSSGGEGSKLKDGGILTAEGALEWGYAYKANAAGASFNLALPAATANGGSTLSVKISVGSGVNTVTLVPNGAEKVNGSEASLVLSVESTPFQGVTLVAVNGNPEVF